VAVSALAGFSWVIFHHHHSQSEALSPSHHHRNSVDQVSLPTSLSG
jgi:hypothetical protein